MAVMHRALFTWFTVLIFLILLVLRLDNKVLWNWFLIFTPLWLFDAVVIIYITVNMIVHCKNGYDRNDLTMPRKLWFMATVVLKLTFQVMLCLKWEYFSFISLYIIMIPFWLLTSGACLDVFRGLVKL
ncbi:transmembrane protein 60-like [Gigantopelta aegis]|uniref:transmembrane protein 60-like n=1 Tax=Gigantopelta aegis TaxID=1735272 RepID=UPI001B8882E8|nr:transmembrane protein 60-like [Gigantopelta aegis]